MTAPSAESLASSRQYTRAASPWRTTLVTNGLLLAGIIAAVVIGQMIDAKSFDSYHRRIITNIGYSIILAVSLQLINGVSGQFSLGHVGFMAVGAYLTAYPVQAFSEKYQNPSAVLLFYTTLVFVGGIVAALLYLLVTAVRKSGKLHRSLPGILLLGGFVWILVDLSQAAKNPSAVWIWSNSMTGIGQAFNWLIEHGRPAADGISRALPETVRKPLSYMILLVGGGVFAAVTGLLVGLPTLRLRGDYLAIATLGFGEIIRIGIINSQPLGGALGLTSIPRYTNTSWLYAMVVITATIVWRVAYSAKGRAIQAVRDDEIAASAVGIDTTHHKVVAFMIGAFFAGVCGALFAMGEYSITPTRFTMDRSIEIVVMVTLGGLGSISGAIIAAIVLTLLPEVLRGVNEYRMIIYSLTLVLMMLLRPQGLLGGYELWPKRKRRLCVPDAGAGHEVVTT